MSIPKTGFWGTFMSEINERIAQLLNSDNKRFSQVGLHHATGASTSAISRWIKEGSVIDAKYIIPISEYFGISVNTLLTGSEDSSNEVGMPAGIDPLLMRLISRLNRDQQIELRGYVKRMLDEPVAEGSSEVHVKAAK